MNEPVAWPEKAWLYDDGGDLIDCGIPDCDGITVEYIRADLASPLTQEEMRKVLSTVARLYGMTQQDSESRVEAIAILKGKLK